MNKFIIIAAVIGTALLQGCSKKPVEVMRFSLNRDTTLRDTVLTTIDEDISADGNGAVKVSVSEPTTVRLLSSDKINMENVKLIYTAQLRSRDLDGTAYLEIWCVFNEKGRFFSRGLNDTISGNTDWKTIKTPFFLKEGQNPKTVQLNLVVNGSGTVWIDDIRLLAAEL